MQDEIINLTELSKKAEFHRREANRIDDLVKAFRALKSNGSFGIKAKDEYELALSSPEAIQSLSSVELILKILEKNGKPMEKQKLFEAIQAAGWKSSRVTFGTYLSREKKNKKLASFGRGQWGLAKWKTEGLKTEVED